VSSQTVRIPASEQQATDWVHHLKKAYLSCRAWGHSWPHIEDPKHRRYFNLYYDNGAGEKVLYCTCMRCGRVRYTISGINSPIFPAAWRVYTSPKKDYAAPYGAMKHLKGATAFRNEAVRRYEEEVRRSPNVEAILMEDLDVDA
jgi:hypothetical protein